MESIENQLENLKDIEKILDNCNDKLNEMTKVDDINEKIDTMTDPNTKCQINWSCAYGIYTSYYMYLLLNEQHPKDHPLMKEIKRLQEFKEKINNASNSENDKTNNRDLISTSEANNRITKAINKAHKKKFNK